MQTGCKFYRLENGEWFRKDPGHPVRKWGCRTHVKDDDEFRVVTGQHGPVVTFSQIGEHAELGNQWNEAKKVSTRFCSFT